MSEQKIEAPTESDVTDIAQACVHASNVIEEALGSRLSGTRSDLQLIQRLLDKGIIEPEATYTLQALGVAFGNAFVHEHSDYDWWMVEDEYGRDPAIRYQKTTLLAFPRTMISKRVEDGETVDVADLFDGLARRLAELAEKGWT